MEFVFFCFFSGQASLKPKEMVGVYYCINGNFLPPVSLRSVALIVLITAMVLVVFRSMPRAA